MRCWIRPERIPGPGSTLERHRFFRNRAFLPQSLLSQLLQIYQESRSDAASPLAKFVGNLLGLDRLDALEAGLKPLADLRNLRKAVDSWSPAEIARDRREQFVNDRKQVVASLNKSIEEALGELKEIGGELGLTSQILPNAVDFILLEMKKDDETKEYDQLIDRQRTLNSIRRQIASADGNVLQPTSQAEAAAAAARSALATWEQANSEALAALRLRITELLPALKLSSDLFNLEAEALSRLQHEHQQLAGQSDQIRQDLRRLVAAQNELQAAQQQMTVIDAEVGQLSANAGVLSSVLGELGSYINSDVCPVCERNFSELHQGSLHEHVQRKVVHLSASAARLLNLGKSKGESQQVVGRLQLEVETLESRKTQSETLTTLDRRSAQLGSAIAELQKMGPAIAEGARLRADDVARRRAFNELQSRSSVLLDARETIDEFAKSIGASGPSPEEGFEGAAETSCQSAANGTGETG